jgi:uncharacterized protein
MKKLIYVKGMHCNTCEYNLEDKIKRIPGVRRVSASAKTGTLSVEGENIDYTEVENVIKKIGYEITQKPQGFFNNSPRYYKEISLSILVVAILFIVFRWLAPDTFLGSFINGSSYPALFIMGLVAGVSSCMALIGGLVLGMSAKFSEEHAKVDGFHKFKPHIFFNLGRLISFFLLGGLLGIFGSFFQVNALWVGFISIIVALVIFFLGVQLTEISPRITSLALPKKISGSLGLEDTKYSHKRALLVGGATFLIPCGFTQAAQVIAVASGSFLRGALLMFLFALGTTPGLLSIGGLTSLLKNNNLGKYIFRAIGIILVILSFYNLKNGLNLLGINPIMVPAQKEPSQAEVWTPVTKEPLTGGTETGGERLQVIKAVYDPISTAEQYVIDPKDFAIELGVPTRFEVLAKKDGIGCMGSITLPGLQNVFKVFEEGETAVFEFTPKKAGTYQIACAMGIPMGTIKVK